MKEASGLELIVTKVELPDAVTVDPIKSRVVIFVPTLVPSSFIVRLPPASAPTNVPDAESYLRNFPFTKAVALSTSSKNSNLTSPLPLPPPLPAATLEILSLICLTVTSSRSSNLVTSASDPGSPFSPFGQ